MKNIRIFISNYLFKLSIIIHPYKGFAIKGCWIKKNGKWSYTGNKIKGIKPPPYIPDIYDKLAEALKN